MVFQKIKYDMAETLSEKYYAGNDLNILIVMQCDNESYKVAKNKIQNIRDYNNEGKFNFEFKNGARGFLFWCRALPFTSKINFQSLTQSRELTLGLSLLT